jgi:hypothetical protein
MEIIELLLRKKISNDVTKFILIINGNLLYKYGILEKSMLCHCHE